MSNSTLRTLVLSAVDMTSAGVRCLLTRPAFCSTLESLDLSWNPLGDEGVSLVAEFLANNTTLKCLDVINCGCGLEGTKHLASALARNTSLEKLDLGIIYENQSPLKKNLSRPGTDFAEGIGEILGTLSPNVEDSPHSLNDPKNSNLRELGPIFCKYV